MTPQRLSKLQGLGGKVVELELNSGRHAIGFVEDANSDRIVLQPVDRPKALNPATYRTSQTHDFIRLDQGEAVSLEHNPPPPGTRVIIRYLNHIKVCGYAMKKNGTDYISLAREALGGRNKRPHQHRCHRIQSSYLLKPVTDES
jgi:hypothetical protein